VPVQQKIKFDLKQLVMRDSKKRKQPTNQYESWRESRGIPDSEMAREQYREWVGDYEDDIEMLGGSTRKRKREEEASESVDLDLQRL